MKKVVWLSLGALVLLGILAVSVWYVNEEGQMQADSRNAFIPYNSAVVVSVNGEPHLNAAVERAFEKELQDFRAGFLSVVTDTLRSCEYVKSFPYVVAMRVEGKNDIRFLYAMDNRDVLSRSEMSGFLCQTFPQGGKQSRKYDKFRIYTIRRGKETVYFAVCGGIILISDSDLYIEDGLKQFDQEGIREENKPEYQNLDKYFSAGAGINVFLNSSLFSDVLPMYLQVGRIFPHIDLRHFFKWGALDGELDEEGVCLNGFLSYAGNEQSFVRTLERQRPVPVGIDGIVPARLMSLGLLNLSDLGVYFADLDAYLHRAGGKDRIYSRKQQYLKMFGKGHEEELRELLQGEFAVVNLAFDEASGGTDGLVIASLKSGGIGKVLIEKMLDNYASLDGDKRKAVAIEYDIDRDRSFAYYRFPAEDLASVYWGYLFEGIKCRYVMVEDNYLIFASSENAVRSFAEDYVHGNFIRDAGWYRLLRSKLSEKYNAAYFACTEKMLPVFGSWTSGRASGFVGMREKDGVAFPSFALQWSNEGEMLYSTLFLSSAPVEKDEQTHLLWQTRLDAKVSMKPVPVVNHNTGERELFVQDEQHAVYLINDIGRILWKLQIDGAINSDVYQVDLYRNGKLQFLFSTASRIYVLDRNGHAVGNFPLAFPDSCENGITVYDYDNSRDYRIFAPCADRMVYLFGPDGKRIEGWKPGKTDKQIVSRVRHFRMDGKDYLVFADRYRLYILDRKGKERVRVNTVFDLKERTDIYGGRKGGQTRLVFGGSGGKVYIAGLDGATGNFSVPGLTDGYRMNVADVDRDGEDECIFTDGSRLLITDLDGKTVSDRKIDAGILDFPYVYRFSASDIRIGVLDSANCRMMMLAPDGDMSDGFPIDGESPFSIVFSGEGNFFLYAGAGGGIVIKYRVSREK